MTGNPPDLRHVALHLSKYAGELASIAEHLDHPDDPVKAAKARGRAKKWIMGKRRNAVVWSTQEAERLLQPVAFPEPKPLVCGPGCQNKEPYMHPGTGCGGP